MGFENRPYARFNAPRRGGGFMQWEVWKKIIAINVVVFLLQIFVTRAPTADDVIALTEASGQQLSAEEYEGLSPEEAQERIRQEIEEQLVLYGNRFGRISPVQNWFELTPSKVLQGQVWRLVTSAFCHDPNSIMHILFNMLFLYWFGRRLEGMFGSFEFGCFYLAGVLISAVAYIVVAQVSGSNVPAIGASGGVWAVMAFYALTFPYDKIYIYFLFPVEIRFVAIIYFLFDLHPVLLQLAGYDQSMIGGNTAHAAHVGGAILGFMYWRYHWRIAPWVYPWVSKWFPNSQPRIFRPQSRSQVWKNPQRATVPFERKTVVVEPRETLRDSDALQLDQILAKISEHGRDSLNAEEEEFLKNIAGKLNQRTD